MASLKKRNGTYYAQYYIAGRQKRITLQTDNYQIAKAKLSEITSALIQGTESPLPTKTPTSQALSNYIHHMQAAKTPGSVQRDVRILRMVFGPICPEIPAYKFPQEHRQYISAAYFEQITTAQLTEYISANVRKFGLAPRTANRFREVLNRLFNWSMKQGGIKMPCDRNPVASVERYRQKASNIRFLTLNQISEQLDALEGFPQYQAMAAVYIYAGLRREEALWLQMEDIDLSAAKYGMLRIRAKTVNGEYWQPKTAKNRAVPISSSLRAYLDNYCPRPSRGGWYFPSPRGLRYNPENFSSDYAHIQKKIGLKWTCLDFRHTFGSQLAMKGESLYKISTLMGNSPEICRTHYAALIPEALGDCVEFGYPKNIRQQQHSIG
ncbi:MAG TPA: tyrosine-type recombinase/integrase [Phycisphaerae bacterium]|nr:tyrosine-type recombinase/integrase [Phycisphaerae bacterium]